MTAVSESVEEAAAPDSAMCAASDLKACFILESLQHRIAGCEVDYVAFHGMHRFRVEREGARLEVGLHEQALAAFGVDDLKRFLSWVSDHAKAPHAPRRMVVACL